MTDTLNTAIAYREAGFAVHWLKEKSKAPAGGDGWQDAPVATADQLRATYRAGMNLGLRTGEPSQVAGLYAHVFDVDIRFADLADEAWDKFDEMFPGIRESLPCVASGSGGESRHLHFLTDKQFYGRKLAVSDAKHTSPSGGPTYNWEIDLFGTGRQVAMPPSIHPVTGIAYRWEREYDLDGLEFGGGPIIDSEVIESLGIASTAKFEFESRPPLTFAAGQLERDLDKLPLDVLDDRPKWVTLGQALHHQFGGAQEGFDLWMRYSAKSKSHLKGSSLRAELRRYRGFGRNRREPVTMGTVLQWNSDARRADLMADLDDLPDDLDSEPQPAPPSSNDNSDFDDLLDDEPAAPSAVATMSDEDVFSVGLDDALDWKSLLAFSAKDESLVANLHNLRLIIENDHRTTGVMAFNEFTQEVVQRGTPGVQPPRRKNQSKPVLQLAGASWKLRDKVNGDFWTEDKDNAIRAIIEAPKTQGGYGIKVPDRDLRAAIDLVGRKNGFHPVCEYLLEQKWDGKPRVESLFVDYLGAPDDAYHRTVAMIMLVAAVARVFEPGTKFDTAVILEGVQGKRKSTFISILAKNWFVEVDCDITDTQKVVELLQGAWIAELNELGGFTKADVRHVKAFISRRSDKVRLAYAKRAQEYHRQSILIGSTNDLVYLRDNTGGRRFLPVKCETEQSIDTDRLTREIDQIWAEALTLYHALRAAQPHGTLPLYLANADAQKIAERLQESRLVESSEEAIAGRIEEWLSQPVFTGDISDEADGRTRNKVCLLEIWCECLQRDEAQYTGAWPAALGRAMRAVPGWHESTRRDRFGKYGQQRGFNRDGWVADALALK